MRNISMIGYPDAILLDMADPIQVFSSANEFLNREEYKIAVYSEDGKPVRTTAGVEIIAHHPFQALPHDGAVIVPGGRGVNRAIENSVLVPFLQSEAANQKRVISVCSGSMLLAATGLMDGRKATTHWSREHQAKAMFPQVKWDTDRIFIRDGKFYSSAGVTTGIDLCLHILEEDHGRELALGVARELVLFMRRTGNQSQYSDPLKLQSQSSSKVRELCSLILDAPTKSWRLADMMEVTNMTERTLHRHFTSELGESPSQYVERVRLNHARSLMDQGAKSTKQIAASSGFGNEQAMRRAFVNHLAITPAEYRKRFGKYETV